MFSVQHQTLTLTLTLTLSIQHQTLTLTLFSIQHHSELQELADKRVVDTIFRRELVVGSQGTAK